MVLNSNATLVASPPSDDVHDEDPSMMPWSNPTSSDTTMDDDTSHRTGSDFLRYFYYCHDSPLGVQNHFDASWHCYYHASSYMIFASIVDAIRAMVSPFDDDSHSG